MSEIVSAEIENQLKAGVQDKAAVESLVRRINAMFSSVGGDILLDIAPATVNRDATAALWTRDVVLTLQDSDGNVHDWCNTAFTTTLSVGDTSSAGTATIVSTTLTFVAGVATIVVSGDAAAWLAAETDTLTVANMTILGYTVVGGTSVQTFV